MKYSLRACAMALVGVAGLFVSVAVAPAASAATTTIVSLTFDDGPSDDAQLPSLLGGLPATLFVNSGRIGASGYLTWDQLTSLQSGGYEIGGHTVNHADLPTLSADEQKREVCDDRSNLLSHGLSISSFAYPYGDTNSTTEQIVAGCGYNSARTVGGLVSPSSCSNCPVTDTVPPSDKYDVATPDSVKSSTTLSDLQSLVTNAEAQGGWLPLVFHHICSGSSCPVYSVDPGVLQQFASWLAGQSGNGVTVQTYGSVIGGAVQPAVAGPPAPAPQPGDEMLQNPSLETSADGTTPDCWAFGQSGTNTRTWTRTNDAHSGSFAERVDVSNYTSGDAKLVSKQDLGQCAPPATPGHVYALSAWYKSDSTPRFTAFYRDSSGSWHYFKTSSAFPSSSGWNLATTQMTAPAGTTALSMGLSISSNGFLTVDDLSLVDTDHPTVTLTSPADGSTAKGLTSVTADASAPSGIAKVELLVDGAVVDATSSSPYAFAWDSTKHADGTAAIAVRATDNHGNVATTRSISLTVANAAPGSSGSTAGSGGSVASDHTAPSVRLLPLPTATLASRAQVAWAGSDSGSGVRSYDVRYRRANYNSGWSSWIVPKGWQGIAAVRVSLGLSRGYSYCAEVRGRDLAGNVSPWTTARCVTSALDDRALSASHGWMRGKGKGFYAGTFTATKQRNATLSRSGGRVDRVGVVATKCKTCGQVAIYVGKKLVGKVNLYSKTTKKAQLILLPRFAYRTGTVFVKVLSSNKLVQIDGLVATRT